jgi:hypothetical protein
VNHHIGGGERLSSSNADFDEYWRYHLTREHLRRYPAPRVLGKRQAGMPGRYSQTSRRESSTVVLARLRLVSG